VCFVVNSEGRGRSCSKSFGDQGIRRRYLSSDIAHCSISYMNGMQCAWWLSDAIVQFVVMGNLVSRQPGVVNMSFSRRAGGELIEAMKVLASLGLWN
jgi:hypothetical protein